MDYVVKYGEKNGYKSVSLEVPGVSQDARHIYEKIGFNKVSAPVDEEDIWGGLTYMKKKLN